MPASPALTRLSSGHYNTGDWNATTNQGGMGGDGHRQALVPPKPPQTGNYPVLTSDIAAVAAEVAADAQAAATASQTAEALAGSAITGLSTSTLTISTGTVTLLTETQKAWVPGMRLRIGQVMAPNVDFMDVQVTSYDAGTGALTGTVTAIGGSGTHASWSLRPLAAATQSQFDARMASDLMVAPSHLAMGADLYGGTLTAAATLLLPAVGTDFDVVGVTPINAISNRPRGRVIHLTFASEVTLAHSATLTMPDGIDLTVPAGGTLTLRALSAGWQVISQNIRRATTTAHGTARLATQAALDTRTSSTDAVTPALLAHGLGLTGTSVTAASTLALPAVGDDFLVTGAGATIAAISARTPAGRTVRLKFAGANTLVHSASFALFTGSNVAGEAGDILTFKSTAAGWEMVGYERASGRPLVIVPPAVSRLARTSNIPLGVTDQGALIDVSGGTFTQTFAAAATLGNGWWCYIRNSGTGDVTLDPNGAETIDGLTSFIMYPGEVRLLQCDGAVLRSIVVTSFRREFTTSQNYIQPPGYNAIDVSLIGGGGGGGGGAARNGNSTSPGAGGGGGGQRKTARLSLPAGTSVSVTVGAGGTGGSGGTTASGSVSAIDGPNGVAGGTTMFGNLLRAVGGGFGFGTLSYGSGGEGGGEGTYNGNTNTGRGFGRPGNSDFCAEYGGGSGSSGSSSTRNGGSSLFGGGGGGGAGWTPTDQGTPWSGSGGAGGSLNWFDRGGGGSAGSGGYIVNASSAGSNGANATIPETFGGSGGGGGGSVVILNRNNASFSATNGGNGGFPGGGGGGGGSLTADGNSYSITFTTGAGGNGGHGVCIVKGVL